MYSIAFGKRQKRHLLGAVLLLRRHIIYVGDDSGNLHQFTGVFTEFQPSRAALAGKPEYDSALAPPVFDETSGLILVATLQYPPCSDRATGAFTQQAPPLEM